eukprot:2295855-Pleurochrysis_carterae.AAC.1
MIYMGLCAISEVVLEVVVFATAKGPCSFKLGYCDLTPNNDRNYANHDLLRFSTAAIESWGARLKRIGRRVVCWRPYSQNESVLNYLHSKTQDAKRACAGVCFLSYKAVAHAHLRTGGSRSHNTHHVCSP